MNLLIADKNAPRKAGILNLVKNFSRDLNSYHVDGETSLLHILTKQDFERLILSTTVIFGNIKIFLKKIKRMQPEMKILLITDSKEIIFPQVITSSGLDGIISTDAPLETFRTNMAYFIKKGVYLSTSTTSASIKASKKFDENRNGIIDLLTPREKEVVFFLINGTTVQGIAQQLCLSVSAVREYRKRAFKKLNVTHLPELIELIDLTKKFA